MPDALVNFVIRGAQIICAAVVCGLSIDLARGHHWGGLPVILGYVAFVGCASLLGAFAGLASSWIDVLSGMIGLLIDGFIILINLAGGLLIAIKLKGITCSDSDNIVNSQKLLENYLMNGGKNGKGIEDCFYCQSEDGLRTLLSRCKKNQADSAFMFITVVVLLASVTMTYLRMKKGY